jgi:type VI secretion system protein ImpL
VKANSSGDSCLQEPKGLVAGYRQDAELEHKIQGLFVRDYIENWRKFVNGFSVLHYNNAADAALKLNLLADHRSPLLAVFALASKNTNFVVPPPSAIEKSIAPINSVFNKAKETLNGIKKDPPPADAKQIDSTADIVAAFQPVQWVVPPAGDTWVSEKNNAYVDALALLGQSMDAIAHNTNADPAIDQTATQNYDKALNAARQLEERLSPNTNGLDTSVQRLLEEPIVQARNLIPVPLDIPKKTNSQAQRFCSGIASTLRKFPFHTSTEDVPLGEFAYLFAPGSGAIWKFEADTLADSVVKDGSQWKPKDGAKLPITGGMLSFLNHAQQVTDAFFPKGGNQPQLLYTLRPKLDPAFQNTFVELEVDGQLQQWRNSLQHQFVWPAAAGGSGGRAVGRVVTGEGVSFSFSSYGGVWAVFRMMREAEPRLQGSKIVEWKYSRGREGLAEPIKPAPVRLEFVEFPAGADVFNPKFFDGLQCPVKAVQELQ